MIDNTSYKTQMDLNKIKHTLVSSAASVLADKGAVRPWKLPAGAKAAAEPMVARKATVENFIFSLIIIYLTSLRCCESNGKGGSKRSFKIHSSWTQRKDEIYDSEEGLS
jgi:hypothetical protein